MRDAQPGTIFLKDYTPPSYLIRATALHFELFEDHALVSSSLTLVRNPQASAQAGEAGVLELHGQELELLRVKLDGRVLEKGEYSVTDSTLRLENVPQECILECHTRIAPQNNTSLEGLYKSRTMFCTQCEAEGFRKITYYLDRPDVLSEFTVTVDAEQARYPVLLSNGNLQSTDTLPDGRHRAVWHDPFPKPAYLFALVAGDLGHVEDSFTTASGRDVCLRIYVEEKDLEKCGHAMRSLQASMRWDEEVYGREYDLDIFNIVAVDDFNMGAMENKSLNIFNTSCVLCSPEITTDAGFARVEAIVAHEYFHNWSGNRITCRDWFQLSLKEGFTVFRDAEFSADMGSRTVKRVEDATLLRTAQFAEDAGPMAHPIRPDSFMEINNFYTLTVYEKGAEVVRMIHTLLGPEKFRAGSDLYFDRHDGQAVTCEDFVVAMEDASGVDLTQFRRWYSQAGTPVLTVSDNYDEDSHRYTLTVEQSCPPTPGQPDKEPLVIPLAVGLLGDAGNLPLKLAGEAPDPETGDNTHRVLQVNQPSQQFVFEQVMERPVPSLLRGFSAPVRLQFPYGRADLCALMRADDDGFVRWDSAQSLAIDVICEVQAQLSAGQDVQVDAFLVDAFADLLRDESLDPAMVAEMLSLPAQSTLIERASQAGGADVEGIHAAREGVQKSIGIALSDLLLACYARLTIDAPYAPSSEQVAARSLRNVCLRYLVAADQDNTELAQAQFESASNMTDRLSALSTLAQYGATDVAEAAIEAFYQQWQHETLAVNQWFQLQAAIPDARGLERVQGLLEHEAFDFGNPNKLRAVVGVFSGLNHVNFHRADGSGYRLLADVVLQMDAKNPQIASRLLGPLTKWQNYKNTKDAMREQLERIAQTPDLSPDVFEVVSKSLK
ncbi:MAG: aminopeptidase N [Halioglobus sp.]